MYQGARDHSDSWFDVQRTIHTLLADGSWTWTRTRHRPYPGQALRYRSTGESAMPRHVDHEARRAAITDAALDLVADGGTAAVNFAARLQKAARRVDDDGSRNYYCSQQELINDVPLSAPRRAGMSNSRNWKTRPRCPPSVAISAGAALCPLVEQRSLRRTGRRINLLSSQIVGRGHRPASYGMGMVRRSGDSARACQVNW